MYPGQPMLEKRNKDKSKTQVFWADISPDQTYKKGNWKITVEFEESWLAKKFAIFQIGDIVIARIGC